jgi:nitrate reductase NapD
MKIASLVVRARPECLDALGATLTAIPGVELHGKSAESGRLVVTVEDGEGYSMADSLLAVSQTGHVLGVTLAYEYTDEGLAINDEYPEPLPGRASAVRAAVAGGAQDKEA